MINYYDDIYQQLYNGYIYQHLMIIYYDYIYYIYQQLYDQLYEILYMINTYNIIQDNYTNRHSKIYN